MKVLVTGANGFIGSALCTGLRHTDVEVVRGVRSPIDPSEVSIDCLHNNVSLELSLKSGIDSVVHLAGRVPPMSGYSEAYDGLYRQVNAERTANLARLCARYGVRRFVFVSTIKVLGEGRTQPYRDDELPAPSDEYAASKWLGEQALSQVSSETGMEIVVLRPPLVYGPGVKGNFLRLLESIDRRRPLPFACIRNQRSLIYLGNLVDIIRLCLSHPKAAGKTFLVSDASDVSTPELVRLMSDALGRRALLVPIPVAWIALAGSVFGKQAAVDRLLGSLVVDVSSLKDELGWQPPYTIQTGLAATAAWYRESSRSR